MTIEASSAEERFQFSELQRLLGQDGDDNNLSVKAHSSISIVAEHDKKDDSWQKMSSKLWAIFNFSYSTLGIVSLLTALPLSVMKKGAQLPNAYIGFSCAIALTFAIADSISHYIQYRYYQKNKDTTEDNGWFAKMVHGHRIKKSLMWLCAGTEMFDQASAPSVAIALLLTMRFFTAGALNAFAWPSFVLSIVAIGFAWSIREAHLRFSAKHLGLKNEFSNKEITPWDRFVCMANATFFFFLRTVGALLIVTDLNALFCGSGNYQNPLSVVIPTLIFSAVLSGFAAIAEYGRLLFRYQNYDDETQLSNKPLPQSLATSNRFFAACHTASTAVFHAAIPITAMSVMQTLGMASLLSFPACITLTVVLGVLAAITSRPHMTMIAKNLEGEEDHEHDHSVSCCH